MEYNNELFLAIMERTIKRLWIVIIILIILFMGSNAAWMYYESQFEETTTTTVEQDTEGPGNNTFIGRDNYGETTGDDNQN